MEQKRRKILIVSNNKFYGGGEKFIETTLSGLSEYFELFFLLMNDNLYQRISQGYKLKFTTGRYLFQLVELRKIVKKIKPDLVLLNGGSSIFFSFFLPEYKKIIIRHSTNSSIRKGVKWLYIALLHAAYWMANRIIHVSEYSLNEQKTFRRKAVCIHNGVDVSSEKRLYDMQLPIDFLFCGRVDKTKGIDIIVEAFQRVSPSLAVLHVVGDGAFRKNIPVKDNIVSYGFVDKVNDLYKKASVFISLSKAENCPLTILEAMNNSMPILTSAVGGIPELVIDNYNGIFISRTVDAAYTSILHLVQNPSLISCYGNNSKFLCRRSFDVKNKIMEYKDEIEKCLNK